MRIVTVTRNGEPVHVPQAEAYLLAALMQLKEATAPRISELAATFTGRDAHKLKTGPAHTMLKRLLGRQLISKADVMMENDNGLPVSAVVWRPVEGVITQIKEFEGHAVAIQHANQPESGTPIARMVGAEEQHADRGAMDHSVASDLGSAP